MISNWRDLPNAQHIDRILDAVMVNSDLWEMDWNQEWDDAWRIVTDTSTKKYTSIAIWEDLAACVVYGSRALYAARGAIMALIADDDCAYMLDSNPGELAILAALGDARAILILPACIRLRREL